MAITFRAASEGTDNGGSVDGVILARPAGVVSGDVMFAVVVADNDVGGIGNIQTPTGWTLIGSSSVSSRGTVGVYQRIAGGSEASSWQWTDLAPSTSDVDYAGGIVAFYGSYDAANPIKAGPTFATSGTSTTQTFVAPSVTGVAGGVLICGFLRSDTSNSSSSFSTPSGMAERVDISETAWVSAAIDTQDLTDDGATGTRTSTCSDAARYTTVSFVLGPTSGGPASGPLVGSLGALAGDVSGDVIHQGSLTAGLTALTAEFAGNKEIPVTGTFAATLSGITASFMIAEPNSGPLVGALPLLTVDLRLDTQPFGPRVVHIEAEDRSEIMTRTRESR